MFDIITKISFFGKYLQKHLYLVGDFGESNFIIIIKVHVFLGNESNVPNNLCFNDIFKMGLCFIIICYLCVCIKE